MLTLEDTHHARKMLQKIKEGGVFGEFNIDAMGSDYLEYVRLGTSEEEARQLLMMCYMVSPTGRELRTWTTQHLRDYIISTDSYYRTSREYWFYTPIFRYIEEGY